MSSAMVWSTSEAEASWTSGGFGTNQSPVLPRPHPLGRRYIPADVSFDDRAPKEIATEHNIPADFRPSE